MPPPPRRRPVPSTPAHRPKVAGLHRPPTSEPTPGERADRQAPANTTAEARAVEESAQVTTPDATAVTAAPEPTADPETADLAEPTPAEPDTADPTEPRTAAPADPDGTSDPLADPGTPADLDGTSDTLADPGTPADLDGTSDTGAEAAPKPTGRKRTSTRVPSPAPRKTATPAATTTDVDADAESDAADAADEESEAAAEAGRTRSPLLLPLVLVLVAAVLGGLGLWFQTRNRDVRLNQALVDTGATTEVSGQAREAVEKAFSYNFADVTATERAANELLVGKAKCQYNAIFGPVRTLAPEQKLVVTVRVVSSGVTSLEGDRATVLLFIDQVTTRTTDNQTGGGIAMMRVGAQRSDGRWKVDNMEMFGQTGDQSTEMAKCAG